MEDAIKKDHFKYITEEINGEKLVSKGKINTICEALKGEL